MLKYIFPKELLEGEQHDLIVNDSISLFLCNDQRLLTDMMFQASSTLADHYETSLIITSPPLPSSLPTLLISQINILNSDLITIMTLDKLEELIGVLLDVMSHNIIINITHFLYQLNADEMHVTACKVLALLREVSKNLLGGVLVAVHSARNDVVTSCCKTFKSYYLIRSTDYANNDDNDDEIKVDKMDERRCDDVMVLHEDEGVCGHFGCDKMDFGDCDIKDNHISNNNGSDGEFNIDQKDNEESQKKSTQDTTSSHIEVRVVRSRRVLQRCIRFQFSQGQYHSFHTACV